MRTGVCYDAAQSRHITIDDIRDMVIAGTRVKVIEDKSNEDITRLVLLQVIADQEQFGRPILSTSLLESMIRFYGNSMQSYFSSYLEKSVEAFIRQQELMQQQLNRTLGPANGAPNPLADLGSTEPGAVGQDAGDAAGDVRAAREPETRSRDTQTNNTKSKTGGKSLR